MTSVYFFTLKNTNFRRRKKFSAANEAVCGINTKACQTMGPLVQGSQSSGLDIAKYNTIQFNVCIPRRKQNHTMASKVKYPWADNSKIKQG